VVAQASAEFREFRESIPYLRGQLPLRPSAVLTASQGLRRYERHVTCDDVIGGRNQRFQALELTIS
jgi:hypothetical protein